MLFASMSFLWIFLPTVLIVNMLLSKVADGRLRYTLKNVWLLIASLIFYAWGGIYYLLIMLFSIVLIRRFLWVNSDRQSSHLTQKYRRRL